MRLRPGPRPSLSRRLGAAVTGERMALVRCAAGVVLLARPTTMAQALGAQPALVGSADWVARMFGARELALGAGVLTADSGSRRAWLLAGALSDAVDTAAMTRALRTGDLGRTGWTRAAAVACTAGAVVAVAAQLSAARR